MALPPQAIEKLTQVPDKTPGAYSQLLILSASLFIIAVLLYFGLEYGYIPYLNNQISSLDTQITNFGKQIPLDKQKEAATFYSQLVNLKTVLVGHNPISPLWPWLEKNTVQNIYFSKLTINVKDKQVVMQGGAKSADDINSQVSVFEKDPDVSRVLFGNAVITPQGPQFTMTVFFNNNQFDSASSTTP